MSTEPFTTPSPDAAGPRRAPVARGLSGWPANPPAFDAVDCPDETLCIPLTMLESSEQMNVLSGSVRAGDHLCASRDGAQHMPVAPVAGIIGERCDLTLFDGRQVRGVQLTPTVRTTDAPIQNNIPPTTTSPTADDEIGNLGALITHLADYGVCAARHDSPDLMEQLSHAMRRPIDTIICNIMDVDPTACVQSAWTVGREGELLAGLSTLARVCSGAKPVITLDRRAPSRWWNALRNHARSVPTAIKFVELENNYPQADPSLLIYTLLNRRLRPVRLPTDLGVILIDAAAAIAIGASVLRRESMLRVPLVVRDHAQGNSYFITAPPGMKLRALLDRLACRAQVTAVGDELPFVLRGGDVLRDRKITLDAVISASELVLHVATAALPLNPDPCIRCGWCFEACPVRIQPANLLEASQYEDLELADRAGLPSCIECGICSYVCPSRLPILRGIRQLRHHENELMSGRDEK